MENLNWVKAVHCLKLSFSGHDNTCIRTLAGRISSSACCFLRSLLVAFSASTDQWLQQLQVQHSAEGRTEGGRGEERGGGGKGESGGRRKGVRGGREGRMR